jgi:hypothetical protein
MKKLTGVFAGICVLAGGIGVALAQEIPPPPKVLVIQREFLKPGRAGSVHERSESAFVRAMAAAKWPTRYFGMDSLSGQSRALFMMGYDSFAAMEKDTQAMEKNATLSAALDRASLADGDLLTEYSQSMFVFREEGSLRSNQDIAHARYFEITQFHIRPGHEKEWDDLVKMYKEAFEKNIPDAKWALYESAYGTDNGGYFLVITPMKSLAEVDQEYADQKKFMSAVGESEMKKLSELSASCIASSQSNLFHFNPKMSYPPEEWIKADPDFWKPKAIAAAPATKEPAAAKTGQ